MKKLLKYIIILIVLAVVSIIAIYFYGISAVSSKSSLVEIEIKENSTFLTISSLLKENDLIRSELIYKIYLKLNNVSELKTGKYTLSQNMSVEEIIDILSKGNSYNPDVVTITFKEGINMRSVAKVIEENTNNTVGDVYGLLDNDEYLDKIINKYWFLTDEIKNDKIYYSLEGYLYPDTYEYNNKNVTVEEIFEKMLNKMDKVLSEYKKEIENSKYSVHEILTLASIIELEAGASDDRAGVAGVFFNRLNNNWSLGSDVTTYYAIKVDMSERDLFQTEINDVNDYNTRPQAMAGKLPISPICIPSKESIESTLKPSVHEFYYFVADKYKKTYFTKTYEEHLNIISKLKEEDLWYTY